MASGLPSLAVNAGGVVEFAEHNVNAWLTRPHDTAAFTDGLDRLLHDPALRARLAAGARITADGRPWDEIHDRLIEDYRRAAASRRRTRAA